MRGSVLLDDDVLLHLLREDIIEDFLHLVPELRLLIFQVGRHEVVALEVDVRLTWVVEVHVGPAVGSREGVDLYERFGGLEFLWVEDVEDGARVVDGRKWEFVVVEVHDLELFQHVVNSLSEGNRLVSLEMVQHALSRHVLVSHLQRNHHKRNVALQAKDLIEGLRVEENVELSCGRDVALADRSSHHHNFCNLLLQFRVCQKENAKIGERASVGPNDLTGMVHDPLEDLLEAALSGSLFRRFG